MSFFYISDDATVEQIDNCDDVAVLVAGGEIDYAASPQLREHLADCANAGKRHLVIDFTSVTFIDSTAIGVLVGTLMRLREHGQGSLTVVCGDENKRVLRIFEIAGVESMIPVHSTREQALSSLALAG